MMIDEEKVEQTMNRAVQKYREMWEKEKIIEQTMNRAVQKYREMRGKEKIKDLC